MPLSAGDRRALLSLARLTLQTYVKTGRTQDLAASSPALCQQAGAFVTLYVLGRRRGQTGLLPGGGPLYRSVLELLVSAAGEQDDWAPIDASELHQTRIEIAVGWRSQPPYRFTLDRFSEEEIE
ncbi:MAG: AMMECR1 domain-containing protein [Chloroflexi bacterium]|nr:AMMECR1 domain-containing protein [Chloroflexota bacterium]